MNQSNKGAPIRIGFTDFWHAATPQEIRQKNPLFRLLSRYFELELSQTPDFLIYSSFGREYLKHDCTRIFYTGENRRPNFKECDYAFSFDYPVDERNYRLPLYKLYGYFDQVFHKGRDLVPATERRFCNFVYSNARARERVRFFEALNGVQQVDSGGRLMNNVGGPVADKLEFLKGYKFTIAFENSSHPGYTTEKVLEALIANTVPIYWGNPLIGRDFNPDCMINWHDFGSDEAVIRRVMEIDQDDDLLLNHLRAPAFTNGVDNEFVNEQNIIERFRTIFSGPVASRVAGASDRLKYWFGRGALRDRLQRHKLNRGST